MNDFLQTLANITQIVSVLWTIFLGGRSIFEIRKLRLQQRPLWRSFSWSFMVNLFSFIIIFVLLLINVTLMSYLRATGNVQQGFLQLPTTLPGKSSLSVEGTPLTPGPLLTPSATVSSGGRDFNKQLTCIHATCDGNLEVTLLFSNVDVSKRVTTLTFSIANVRGNNAYQVYSDNSHVNLQSPLDSKPYEGYQSSANGFSFYISPGERTQQIIQFNLIPYKGISYKLFIDFSPIYEDTTTLDPVALTF